ncbi:MAG: arginase [Planctomycetota bacterium]|nr:arginase [Planctomycetota bacterium]MDG2143921.1 arginase [Planctomycetota bacterium]
MTKKKVCMHGVPMDLGRGHRGVDMGPSAVRITNLGRAIERLGYPFEDLGNVPVEIPERLEPVNESARYLGPIADCCALLRDAVKADLDAGDFPLVIGGDHSIAVGTIAGVVQHLRPKGEELGVIWFDAHGDFNTPETSRSGNVHGMPLASCLGYGAKELTDLAGFTMLKPENVALIGIRELDKEERELIKKSGVKVFTMHDIDRDGMAAVVAEALEIVTTGTAGFHMSFDLDGCDPEVAPGVGTPVPGGVDYRESHYLMEAAAKSGKMVSLEMTEVDPVIDTGNKTAKLTKQLVLSALGKRIL